VYCPAISGAGTKWVFSFAFGWVVLALPNPLSTPWLQVLTHEGHLLVISVLSSCGAESILIPGSWVQIPVLPLASCVTSLSIPVSSSIKMEGEPSVVICMCNPSTWEAEAGGSGI
jgi:hypothetical protein